MKAINVTLEFDRYSHHSVVNACIHVQMWTDFAGAVIAAIKYTTGACKYDNCAVLLQDTRTTTEIYVKNSPS